MDSLPRGVRPASRHDAVNLAAILSADHVREISDTTGMEPAAALALSLAASLESYSYCPTEPGIPIFMMGVEAQGLLTGSAMLWMLAGSGVNDCPRAVLRIARWGIRRAFAVTGAETLEQYIPAWYRTGLAFARRIGFMLTPTALRCRAGGPLWHVIVHRPTHGIELDTGGKTYGSIGQRFECRHRHHGCVPEL